MEFPNGNGSIDEDYITFQDLMDNEELMAGNCFAVADTLEEECGWPAETVYYEDGKAHSFNSIVRDGEKFIIDFTARQYGCDVPVPYVATPEDWKQTIEGSAMKLYGDQARFTEDSFANIVNV